MTAPGTESGGRKPLTFREARTVCRGLGFTLTKTAMGEWRLNRRHGGTEATAYYSDDLEDIVGTCRQAHARGEGGPPPVYLLEAEHWSVPGKITKAFRHLRDAEADAAVLVNIMLKDSHLPIDATAENWRDRLDVIRRLREEDSDTEFYVEIANLPLLESAEGP